MEDDPGRRGSRPDGSKAVTLTAALDHTMAGPLRYAMADHGWVLRQVAPQRPEESRGAAAADIL